MEDKRFEPELISAPGDFYVENRCCISCGVPQAVAPDLIGWVTEDMMHCYWKKQPSAPQEFRQAFAIFDGQEVGCHRYAGKDPEIQRRVGYENCDHAISLIEGVPFAESLPKFTVLDEDGLLRRWIMTIFRKR
jgi:hypothetical protein